MATYVIGDVQGCMSPLRRLLEQIEYTPQDDELWLLGDLVNRGPDSLAVLRWAKEKNINSVLGNHDMQLLRLAAAGHRTGKGDLQEILNAPDRDDLINWLRHRPLLTRVGGHALVHAGLLPHWTVDKARSLAAEIECKIRADDWREHVLSLTTRRHWTATRAVAEPMAFSLSVFTRIRMISDNGSPDFDYKGAPEDAPAGHSPWYKQGLWARSGCRILFGHWASLGHRVLPGATALDGGCVWGGQLVAYRMQDAQVFKVPAKTAS